tara:strand:+ start:247 stop:468 length:222 start_codon:yes stop_codon:yes gene_type:complete
MKVEILEKEVEIQEYPCLKVSKKGEIVLFTSPTVGMLLVADRGCYASNVGYYCTSWYDREFEIFNGKIVLTND